MKKLTTEALLNCQTDIVTLQSGSEFMSNKHCPCEELIELKRDYYLIRKAFNHSFDGIWIIKNDGTVLFVNKANERFYKVDPSLFIGKNLTKLIEDGWFPDSAALQAIKLKKPCTLKINVNERWLYITSIPLYNENGNIEILITNVRDITEIVELEKINQQYKSEIDILRKQILEEGKEIIAVSPKSQELIKLVNKIAPYDNNVLILGESGTGKEVTAKLIHKLSKRKNGPFFAINCAAIPENLLESELFGYEAGAFTGAQKNKPGLLELAQGGTLFLDEIGELPANLQAKLLRTIQDKKIMRLGATKTIDLDVRIISATNQDLIQLIEKGQFRKDLFYRINTVTIKMPPLRERKEDIRHLIYSVLKYLNEKYHQNKIITPRAEELLIAYDWPGNIRELENLLERIYILSDGNIIDENCLPLEVKDINHSSVRNKYSLKEALIEYEKDIIKSTITQVGTLKDAARVLNIDPSTLWRKMQKYGLTHKSKSNIE